MDKTVLKMSDVKKCTLHKYVPKTFMVDVGNLCLPLTFQFEDFAGEFNVYFSYKDRYPGEEQGYE